MDNEQPFDANRSMRHGLIDHETMDTRHNRMMLKLMLLMSIWLVVMNCMMSCMIVGHLLVVMTSFWSLLLQLL